MRYFLKNNLLIILLIILFSFLFVYRFDWNTLVSWDEAWYGSIAREMLKTGDWMRMIWNSKPYYDHPPMGFWLIVISYKLFGISEFSTRLPSVVLSLLTIILVYKTGLELFGKKIIGFIAALVMGTSVWYLIRVRSGNLDAVFIFFYILTIYLALRSSKQFAWFPLTMAAFGGLILSKTLVGFSAGILIVFLNFNQFFKLRNILWFLLGVAAIVSVAFPWYYIHIKNNPLFVQEHFLIIGTRNKSIASYFQINAALPLFYLHMGVRKWYYLWIAGITSLLVTLRFFKKNVFFLFLWNFVILYPFLTSDKSQIWHLIPVYLPMSVIIGAGGYYGVELMKSIILKLKIKIISQFNMLLMPIFLILVFLIALQQIKIFYPEVYPNSKYTPDDVDISKRAGKYKQPIYLDDDFLPIAVFYSNKPIITVISLPDEKRSMLKFFQSDAKDFVMITRNWAVDSLKLGDIPYKILEKNNSFSIVSR
ncbi:MAG: hypothetical protein US11_C0002G0037 [Candidatus Roizmanbacteria bacterium GW2011_GWA2_36_23]|uniref:Glycosyltransferase RgtA/B/C/D-like domain-containing protein n=1 Tax=Candidatus Roizmanbacteria bacterium GW2011_GWA2_36_23 TaxID=1618480 RepID=A0A0G0E4Z6_9BACT|nr:MAG: hypothetical protein US11_C0002G0037 [Candidatus Roizmanbacteria bacterium GW2011_GWA2_36_23]